ncbi:MAG: UDP-N-acetylmuramoyl-tripeptide--D-alanyl-D-alanine ligase [Armatimonadetes bacterium]|nr:UDP-N-acetylmuramoyl-tripeptide--D-alanyl-D-alanine ligase [Armatimonadota bacterium]
MTQIPLSEFAESCGGQLVNELDRSVLKGFATDSRDAQTGDLFLCIRGENVDGHDYAAQALENGAVCCLAERAVDGPHILVDDLVGALAKFAAGKRMQFDGPVVAVTGSTGKTTTKEFCAAALSPLGLVLKNAGNRNSEYTSPLVWAELENPHQAAVIEMGMRGFGQIAHLASFTRPTIGIVTHVGTAHIEKVGSREGILRAKGELLQALPAEGTAILWREDDYLSDLRRLAGCKTLTFGFAPEADCRVLGYRALSWDRCVVRGRLDGETFEAELHAAGRHQALNASAAVLAAWAAGVGVSEAAGSLASAELPALRLQVVPYHGATLVLDTYNASPDSTTAALRTLAELPSDGRRMAVLGEMKELGDFTESGHRLVGRALAECAVDLVMLTGGPTAFIGDEARKAGLADEKIVECESLDLDRVREFLDGVRAGDTVLIKGSRALGLEGALEVAPT